MSLTVLLLSSAAFSVLSIPMTRWVAKALDLYRRNFRGQILLSGYGIGLVVAAVPVYAILKLNEHSAHVGPFIAAVLGFGTVGLADDLYGTREAGGFRGHISLAMKGRLSTGLVKAMVGGALALFLGFRISGVNAAGLVDGFLIALSANTLNLLDLRPGRAVSCFWAGVLALAIIRLGDMAIWPLLLPILVPAVWVTVLDRYSKVMIGDTGSNVLGAVLGMALVYELGLISKLVIIVGMAVVHVYSEKYSISGVIERNPLLRRLDRLLGER